MTAHKLLLAGLGLVAILVIWSVASAQPAAEPQDTIGIGGAKGTKIAKIRVGTFERKDLLIAFYRSTHFDKIMKEWTAELEQAKKDGDEAKAKEIEARGAATQEVAHKQLAGEAPLTNVLEQLKDDMPKIAKMAGVQMIVEKPLFSDGSVELVDITKQMTKCFAPTKKG